MKPKVKNSNLTIKMCLFATAWAISVLSIVCIWSVTIASDNETMKFAPLFLGIVVVSTPMFIMFDVLLQKRELTKEL